MTDGTQDIPVIDATELLGRAPLSPRTVSDIGLASTSAGFAVIDGLFDGSDEDLAVIDSMRQLFTLPPDDDRKVRINVMHRPDTRGWMPLGGEPAYEAGTRARVESFDCGRPGDSANAWPELPDFEARSVALWRRLSRAGFRFMEALAAAHGLEPAFFADRCRSQALSTMRLLHYPGQPLPPAADEVGISAHTDFECMTLLYQTAPGLELRDRDGRWHDAPGGERRVIALFGDMLETWTNGRVRATPHRVRVTQHPRYSMVLFFAVDDAVRVAPLPAFTATGQPSAYVPREQRAHSADRLRRAEQNRDELAASQRA